MQRGMMFKNSLFLGPGKEKQPITREGELRKSTKIIAVETEIKKVLFIQREDM